MSMPNFSIKPAADAAAYFWCWAVIGPECFARLRASCALCFGWNLRASSSASAAQSFFAPSRFSRR